MFQCKNNKGQVGEIVIFCTDHIQARAFSELLVPYLKAHLCKIDRHLEHVIRRVCNLKFNQNMTDIIDSWCYSTIIEKCKGITWIFWVYTCYCIHLGTNPNKMNSFDTYCWTFYILHIEIFLTFYWKVTRKQLLH